MHGDVYLKISDYTLLQLKEMIHEESVDVRAVHQEKVKGFTIGSVWDVPALITYVSSSLLV